MSPSGQIQYFRSGIDGTLSPCAVCTTDTSEDPKPLVLEVSPGALGNLPGCVTQVEKIVEIAARHGEACVALRPTGRGSGSVYQQYGEVDVFEAIEHVKKHYAIDTDRISITGSSMGGAATWYLISHYPDFFSGAAPFCGYCDYRLWKKPGGYTFHMNEWEESSWMGRSAAFLVENLRHTPVWMVHGEWDRAVGGGVSVEHSRQMAARLSEQGFDFMYTEVPETGHGCRSPEIFEEVVPWLVRQRKERSPDRVVHATFTLRHNRSYWAAIEQLDAYDGRASVDCEVMDENRIEVRTENVRTFQLSNPESRKISDVVIDGSSVADVNLDRGVLFQKGERGEWERGSFDLSAEKRRGASGPIGDMFHDGVLLVPGTSGTGYHTHVTQDCAQRAVGFYRERNGGVHRGGIMGSNDVRLRVVNDSDLTEADLKQYNLLLLGTPRSNSVLSRLRDRLPIAFEGDAIRICDRTYTAEGAAVFAVFPHPENPDRYVAVHGGDAPDAICWGSHLDMHLLPDYLVYARESVIDWGFWDNRWRAPA